MKETLLYLFHRDLQRLKAELQLYNKHENVWVIAQGVNNSSGNLVLHLVGNLNTYIGSILGNTGYVRNREKEFSQKDVSIDFLLEQIDQTDIMIKTVISLLSESDFKQNYPMQVWDTVDMNTELFLVHLLGHLNYHLGQISYHRRLLDN